MAKFIWKEIFLKVLGEFGFNENSSMHVMMRMDELGLVVRLNNKKLTIDGCVFEEIFNNYPKRLPGQNIARAEGLRRAKLKFKTIQGIEEFRRAVNNYKAAFDSGNLDPKYIYQFSTFVNSKWLNWVEVEDGDTPKSMFDAI